MRKDGQIIEGYGGMSGAMDRKIIHLSRRHGEFFLNSNDLAGQTHYGHLIGCMNISSR
jgi:hypothetical protein